MFKILVFLGSSSLGRLCMPFCFFIFYAILPTLQHFRLRLVLLSDLWFSDAL
jgi:hypothetical protein